MPEGDTIYRAARRLDAALRDGVLTLSDFRVPSLALIDLSGQRVLEVASRGKHLLMRTDAGVTVHSHLKMEGTWQVGAPGQRWRAPAHTCRAVLATSSAEALGFQVILDVVPTTHEDDLVGHLGPDLLGPDWDPDEATRRLAASPSVPIGDALLDQRNLAGVGNIYKSELCFLHGVDPRTPVGAIERLPRLVARAKLLLEANRDRSNRITTGDRRQPLWVYGGQRPCRRCGTRISQADLGPAGQARVTYWCPECQPAQPPAD